MIGTMHQSITIKEDQQRLLHEYIIAERTMFELVGLMGYQAKL